ncbi:oxidoreductase [Streptococcus pyogenes]|nr:oxidoreductase [Streptococcus pyogenes]
MKIAIVGAGIVGSTAAYYLQQSGQKEVTIFDHGQGQATKAAVVLLVLGFQSVAIKFGTAWLV